MTLRRVINAPSEKGGDSAQSYPSFPRKSGITLRRVLLASLRKSDNSAQRLLEEP